LYLSFLHVNVVSGPRWLSGPCGFRYARWMPLSSAQRTERDAAPFALLVVLALVLLPGGCGRPGQTRATTAGRPNVVLVTIDTLRADRLGCYGYARAVTPTLDGLAA